MAFTPVALSENLAGDVVSTLPAIGSHAFDLLFRIEGSILKQFWDNNAVVKSGGRDIREPIEVQTDEESIKRLAGAMDSAPLVGFEPLMQLREVWKGYGKVLVIDEDQLDDNSGPEKIIDILSVKRDSAVKNMYKAINDDLLYAGADNHINSILYHIAASPSTGPGMHNYSGTSYTFARNIQVTGGSAASGVMEAALNQAVIQAQKAQNVDKVKWLASSPVTARYWRNSLIPMQQAFLSGSAGNISTAGDLLFQGMPWKWDVAFPTDGVVLGINPDYLKIYTKGKAMTFGKPMDVVDQWFMAWKMKVRLNVMFLNLARQFIVTSCSA